MDNPGQSRLPRHMQAGEETGLGDFLRAIAARPSADVTEATAGRELELARQAAELYRSVIDISPDAIIVTDLSGTVLMCNREAASQQGFETPDQLVGLNAFDYLAPEDRERAMANARRTLATGSIRQVEYTVLGNNGRRTPVELSASLICDSQGEARAFIGVVRDITGRKRAEEALRASEERYRILYQDNPSMYFTVDEGGTVLSVNEFGAQQLGYSPDELVGQSVLNVFFEDDKAEVAEQLAACVRNPGEMRHWEFRKVRKDGQVIWVKEAARTTKDSAGETIVLIVCEDITERKRMEEELEQAREELERKVERKVPSEGAYGLTFRELTVLHLVATGSSNKDIASTLGISPLTVSKHVANILTKMGAGSRSEASARAVRESLLE